MEVGRRGDNGVDNNVQCARKKYGFHIRRNMEPINLPNTFFFTIIFRPGCWKAVRYCPKSNDWDLSDINILLTSDEEGVREQAMHGGIMQMKRVINYCFGSRFHEDSQLSREMVR